MPEQRHGDHSDDEERISSLGSFGTNSDVEQRSPRLSSDGSGDNESFAPSEIDGTHGEISSAPPSYHTELPSQRNAGPEDPAHDPVEDTAHGEQDQEKPARPKKVDRIRAWAIQKGKDGHGVAQKVWRKGSQQAKTWNARQAKNSNPMAGIGKRNSIERAKTARNKAQRMMRDRLKRAKELYGEKTQNRHAASHESEELEAVTKLPENPQWLSPKRIAVRIKRPLPPHLRSLDVPVSSSTKSNKHCTYFPETDTHYLPEEEGGPFEVPAARGENLKWLKPYPEQYWVFRSSALKELKYTGKLHWRGTDRWGVPWDEGRWKEDVRPAWNAESRKWDRSVMALSPLSEAEESLA